MADSIWKKELSFGRKKPKGGDAVAEAAPVAEPTVEPAAKKQSFWKKEIAIGKKRVPVADAPSVAADAQAVPAPAEFAVAPVATEEYSWLTASLDAPAAPAVPASAVPAPAVPAPAIPAVPATPVAPVAAEAPTVALPAVSAPAVPGAMPGVSVAMPTPPPAPVPVAPAAPAVPAVSTAPPVVPTAAPAMPVPPPAPGAMPAIPFTPPAVPAVPVAAPAVPPVPVAPPLPVAPEAAPALPESAPAGEPKTPFWKKELKLGRGEKQPKEPKAKKEKKAKEPKPPKAEKAPKEKSEKTPFWKLEVGGKKKKDADFDTPKAGKPAKAKKEKAPKPTKAPKTLAKQSVVGLKIGASQIAAARVQNGDQPQLLQLARETLDDGVVVGGELRDFELLTEQLKQFFAKHKLPKKGVRLGIANNRIGVRTFDITGIDDAKQLANAIRFRAQETLPIPLDEAVLDWQVLSETVDPETGQRTRRVLLVVAYRELVDRYVAACKRAGIRLAGIDLEAFAMLRALNAPLPAEAPPAVGAQVVVNVGHDRSTFAVSDGRVCEFTRVLGWGGSALSVAIARALDVTPSEATPILHALSLVAETELPEAVTPEVAGAAREAVRRELQAFARELVSSLRFYQNQPGSLGIGGLVLTGGTAHLPGFTAELERLIGVPVTIGDPLVRVKLPKKFKEPERVGSLAVAIGLGIED